MATSNQRFDRWICRVDDILAHENGGLCSASMGQVSFVDLFEQRLTPRQAADAALIQYESGINIS